MNTPITFKLAKLLKEKEYNVYNPKQYNGHNDYLYNYTESQCKLFGDVYYAPIIAEVIMWLYEEHGIWIEVTTDFNDKFCWLIKKANASLLNYNSPTEAYSKAIEYTLINLI